MTTTPLSIRVIQKTFHLGDLDGAEKAFTEAIAECRQAESEGLYPAARLQTRLSVGPETGEGEPEQWIYEIHAQYTDKLTA